MQKRGWRLTADHGREANGMSCLYRSIQHDMITHLHNSFCAVRVSVSFILYTNTPAAAFLITSAVSDTEEQTVLVSINA